MIQSRISAELVIAKQIAARQSLRLNSDNASRRSSLRRCNIRQRRTRCKQPLPKTLFYAPFAFPQNNTAKTPLSPRFHHNFHSTQWISRFSFYFFLEKCELSFCSTLWNLVSSFRGIIIGLDCAERGAVYFDLWCNCASIAHGSGRG